MANEPQSTESPCLSATVERCLTIFSHFLLRWIHMATKTMRRWCMRLSHNSRRLFPPNQARSRTQWNSS